MKSMGDPDYRYRAWTLARIRTTSKAARLRYRQSKRMSLVESMANIAVGYAVAIFTQVMVFPLFGIVIPLHDNFIIGAIFTVVSLARSYALRRLFDKLV